MKRTQRQALREANTKALNAGGLSYKVCNNETVLVLREANKPKVDYYPGTNKWKIVVGNPWQDHYRLGDVNTFIAWYGSQKS
jgi:hypothetical protein